MGLTEGRKEGKGKYRKKGKERKGEERKGKGKTDRKATLLISMF